MFRSYSSPHFYLLSHTQSPFFNLLQDLVFLDACSFHINFHLMDQNKTCLKSRNFLKEQMRVMLCYCAMFRGLQIIALRKSLTSRQTFSSRQSFQILGAWSQVAFVSPGLLTAISLAYLTSLLLLWKSLSSVWFKISLFCNQLINGESIPVALLVLFHQIFSVVKHCSFVWSNQYIATLKTNTGTRVWSTWID